MDTVDSGARAPPGDGLAGAVPGWRGLPGRPSLQTGAAPAARDGSPVHRSDRRRVDCAHDQPAVRRWAGRRCRNAHVVGGRGARSRLLRGGDCRYAAEGSAKELRLVSAHGLWLAGSQRSSECCGCQRDCARQTGRHSLSEGRPSDHDATVRIRHFRSSSVFRSGYSRIS